jgi:hypothetical protein
MKSWQREKNDEGVRAKDETTLQEFPCHVTQMPQIQLNMHTRV